MSQVFLHDAPFMFKVLFWVGASMIVRKMTSWRARLPPPKKTSDVYAVTAGVKGGSFPPLKNLGISMSASALSLHLRTNFHHISFNSSVENRQIFKQKITFLDHFL